MSGDINIHPILEVNWPAAEVHFGARRQSFPQASRRNSTHELAPGAVSGHGCAVLGSLDGSDHQVTNLKFCTAALALI
jgi:hypothetical protein